MTLSKQTPLFLGGTGIVGSEAARLYRARHPDVPIHIAGRNTDRLQRLAETLGNSTWSALPNFHQSTFKYAQEIGAIALFYKDEDLGVQRFAQDNGIGLIDISSAAFEIGPQTALYAESPKDASIVLASNWLAGTSTYAALDLARNFARIDSIRVSALLDDQDIGGSAAEIDYVRQTQSGPSALVRRNGRMTWLSPEEPAETFQSVDGREFAGQAFGNLDILTLSAVTNAPDVRFDFAVGVTATRLRGQPFSHEIIIEIKGDGTNSKPAHLRREITHAKGQAPMTALGSVLLLEALIGLDGKQPAGPGLYFPHHLVAPDRAIEEYRRIGTRIEDRQIA